MRISEIEAAVRAAMPVQSIMAVDESHLHRGHAGARPYGQSHYKLTVVSDAFAGASRVARQRMVFAALGDTVGTDIHALSLNLLTPEQAAG
jgi:BolA protein